MAVGGSFLAGIVDVFRTDYLAVCLYTAIAMLLGFIQPKAVFLISLIAAACYFFCHAVAICIGFKPPHVEKDMSIALARLIVFFPTLAGGAVGALAKQLWRFAQVLLGASPK